MIVTCTPNPSVDRTVAVDAIELGGINRTTAARIEASGKGVNVTRVLTAYGFESLPVLPAGGATGQELVTLLADAGIQARTVPTRAPVRVNLSVITADGTTTKFNEPGGRLTEPERVALIKAIVEVGTTTAASWFAICGALPPEGPPTLVADLVRAAHAAGLPAAVDTSGPALPAAVAAGADLIAPNTAELGAAVGALPVGVDAVVEAALAFAPSATALISMGPDGAVLVRPDGSAWHAVPPTVDVVNTVGAGDALLAGFLAGASGSSEAFGAADEAGDEAGDEDGVPARLARAVAWGTSACTVPGTAEVPAKPVDASDVEVNRIR